MYSVDDSHLPEYTMLYGVISRLDPNFKLYHFLKRAVFPIMLQIKKSGVTSYKLINGTAFFLDYNDETYIVTAHHVITKKKTGKIIDYVLGFEGSDFSENYYFYREILKKKGLTWKWLEIQNIAGAKLNIAVAKISISKDVEELICIEKFYIPNHDFELLKAEQVHAMGYPHGHADDLVGFQIQSEHYDLEKIISSNEMTLLPQILTGNIIGIYNTNKRGIIIYSHIAGGKGISGGPLILIRDGKIYLLGVNISGPVIDKPGIEQIDDLSTKEKKTYGNKLVTVHIGHLKQLLEMDEIKNLLPTNLTMEDLKIEQRQLSKFLSSGLSS